MQSLRFALIVYGNSLERWHLRCLDRLEESAELVGIVRSAELSSSLPRTSSSALMRLYARSLSTKVSLNDVKRFTNVKQHPENAHQSLELENLDFILKLGRVLTPTGLALATRYGIWSFKHEIEGDLLPFFREVYDPEDVTEAALLAFKGPGTLPQVLEQGYFRTEKRSYLKNRDHVLGSIAVWPALVCQRLIRRGAVPTFRVGGAARADRKPNFRPQFVPFCTRIAYRRLAAALERLFRHSQWNIGILDAPVAALLRPGTYRDDNIEWFPLRDRGKFLADPFGVVREGAIHILCECFEYRCSRGHICALDYSAHDFTKEPERAIELPMHMSYPFLIEDAGEIYCVPETSYAEEVALFRAVEFPHRWSKVTVLLKNFGGVDPTVFRHGDCWWLMCTEKGQDADVKLWAWYSPNLRGPWTAHARNPVKTDVRGSRPAGVPFFHEGVLYRPAQDCSKRYGWRIVIQRVKSLTPWEFLEEPAMVLQASAGSPFPLGRHTLTALGDIVLIDGHRAVFVWQAFLSFLRRWACDFTRKLPRRWRRATSIKSCRGLQR
jgi:hypothetical protein